MVEDREDALQALDDRIRAARARHEPEPKQEEHYSLAQQGWRMVTELVAGLLIGFGIGYGLDALFGTSTWLLILFFMFGFAAGVRTMMRTAAEIQKQNSSAGAPTPSAGTAEMYDDD